MNPVIANRFAGSFKPIPRGRGREAFALVVTLLILSLLLIVSVSYLSSMTAEHQTSDAFAASVSAEQAARTGVDSATAMLAEAFRDYPDSATVWDTQQTANDGTAANTAIVGGSGTYNEGTSLYLRAVPKTSNSTIVANPVPDTPGATPAPANSITGNNPDDPTCQTFVLPLISGVPNGQPRLVTDKASIFPVMNLTQADPVQQNWADLNVRQSSGDGQGAIGSPPNWPGTYPANTVTNTPAGNGNGPKPARAYWVTLKGANGCATGRYAFWIDDESFRANVNYVGDPNNPNNNVRADNATGGTGLPRSIAPGDTILGGVLAALDPTNYISDAAPVLATRKVYPAGFLTDPLAFLHSTTDTNGASSFASNQTIANALHYLTTTQSGSLNLTRHGSQRLNLNAITTINPTAPVTMAEIRKMVEAIRFHLPNFGQRFYRSTNPDLAASAAGKSTILNKSNDVSTTNAEIYLYKTAANLRDYIDTDDMPTLLVRPMDGTLLPTLYNGGAPAFPAGTDGKGDDGPNYLWAQGKDGSPLIQEAMLRYRPTVQVVGSGSTSSLTYALSVDYYIELWNMTDHDVTAASLHNPYIRIGNQQPWYSATITRQMYGTTPYPRSAVPVYGQALTVDSGSPAPGDSGPTRDFNIDLVNNVYASNGGSATGPLIPIPGGVVFKAGSATVITTDPDFINVAPNNTPVSGSVFPYGAHPLTPAGIYVPNVYYCAGTTANTAANARRTFTGPVNGVSYSDTTLRGIMPYFRNSPSAAGTFLDFETEVTFGNDLGYLDSVLGAFCVTAGASDGGSALNGYDFTWTTGPTYNDYIHGGSLGGNGNTPSELGDPRTNMEQLAVAAFTTSSFFSDPDQSRYAAPGSSLTVPFSLGTPNSNYVKPASTLTGYTPWSDYYDWQNASYPTVSLTAATAPAVVADSALTSIGQLGDIYDPLRVIGTVGSPTINNSRGGGRTLKIGQRDDRFTYDASGNPVTNSTSAGSALNNVPASNGWAAWRLTDVFCIADALELPARVNINGVVRDGGAALRAALTGFVFQPTTTTDPMVHGAPSSTTTTTLAGTTLKSLPSDPTGVSQLVNYITNRLALGPSINQGVTNGYNTPWGPFFERGELGELENATTSAATSSTKALFGKFQTSALPALKSTDLTGVDLNKTFDRGREELFRRLAELICTRGDTFTVYAVGQSLLQPTTASAIKVTGTQRLRVTCRLVPKTYNAATGTWVDFHPGYHANTDGTIAAPSDFDPTTTYNAGVTPGTDTQGINQRFAKPDRYEVQVLEANPY